jgi:hypothetical protein
VFPDLAALEIDPVILLKYKPSGNVGSMLHNIWPTPPDTVTGTIGDVGIEAVRDNEFITDVDVNEDGIFRNLPYMVFT